MAITEPMTVFTDFLMAAMLCFMSASFLRLWKKGGQRSVMWWALACVALAMGSMVAGIAHGTTQIIDETFNLKIWKVIAILVGMGSYCMLCGIFVAVIKRPMNEWLVILAIPKLLIYVFWILTHRITADDYQIVMYDYGSALVIILCLEIYALFMLRQVSAKWILSGIVVSFISGAVQQSGIVIASYINYNDLYHIISLVSFYLIYRGVRLLKDRM